MAFPRAGRLPNQATVLSSVAEWDAWQRSHAKGDENIIQLGRDAEFLPRPLPLQNSLRIAVFLGAHVLLAVVMDAPAVIAATPRTVDLPTRLLGRAALEFHQNRTSGGIYRWSGCAVAHDWGECPVGDREVPNCCFVFWGNSSVGQAGTVESITAHLFWCVAAVDCCLT